MTDNEIIKALHCKCGGEMICISCPYYARYPECDRYAVRDAILLIYRQSEEIRRLQYDKDVLNKQVCIAVEDAIESRAEAIKEFAERLHARVRDVVVHSAIDCVAKEMGDDV